MIRNASVYPAAKVPLLHSFAVSKSGSSAGKA